MPRRIPVENLPTLSRAREAGTQDRTNEKPSDKDKASSKDSSSNKAEAQAFPDMWLQGIGGLRMSPLL